MKNIKSFITMVSRSKIKIMIKKMFIKLDHIKKQDLEKDNYVKIIIEKCIIQFDEANKNNKRPEHHYVVLSSISGPPCWHLWLQNDTFKVFGVFVHLNVLHHITLMTLIQDVYTGRYSLLNLLYKKIYNDKILN